MPRLLIGNWGNEAEAAGIPAAGLPHATSQGQRMIWGARPGDTEPFLAFLAHLETLGATMRAMGYRGRSNIDAILTADGRVLFNEFNGRYGGSTHLFTIGTRVIGGDYLADRCLIEQRGCAFPAFAAAQRELRRSGLAYDPATRTGVIIPVYGTEADGSGGKACIAGTSLGDAERIERDLRMLFPG